MGGSKTHLQDFSVNRIHWYKSVQEIGTSVHCTKVQIYLGVHPRFLSDIVGIPTTAGRNATQQFPIAGPV
jgi:hypothetical protein